MTNFGMANYPYPELANLLEFKCSPSEYLATLTYGTPPRLMTAPAYKPEAEFWKVLPIFCYAECPICHVRFQEPVDIYSLRTHSGIQDLKKTLFVWERFNNRPSCVHFMGVHSVVNLHGLPPSDRDGHFENRSGEVPFVSEWFLDNDPVIYAVLSALPICRIEDNVFKPSYTEFNLAYFSLEPKKALHSYYNKPKYIKAAQEDKEFWLDAILPPEFTPEVSFELAPHAYNGRLGWMDHEKPERPLQIGVGFELPYIFRNIQGIRTSYTWRDGKLYLPYGFTKK